MLATLTAISPEDGIKEALSHDLYIEFHTHQKKRTQVHLWRYIWCASVFEHCVLSALPECLVIVEPIVRPMLALPTVRVLCHLQ